MMLCRRNNKIDAKAECTKGVIIGLSIAAVVAVCAGTACAVVIAQKCKQRTE